MSQDEKDYKKKIIKHLPEDEDEEGESGAGGQSGQVEFREFIGVEESRDDLLSGEELKRLLIVHESANKHSVQKQKEARAKLNDLKNGKNTLNNYRHEKGSKSEFSNHPLLSNKAQFSGIDKQVNNLPNENESNTNKDKQELRLSLSLRQRYEKSFNPRPQHG